MSNALVPVRLDDAARRFAQTTERTRADFLAHLIATATQAPQARVRRRAEPHEAIAVYHAGTCSPASVGIVLSRSL